MTVKILGLDEIQKKMTSLPDKMQKNVLASGNRAVATQLKKKMIAGTDITTVKRAATVKQAAFNGMRGRNKWTFVVGLRIPFSSLAHLVEFGTGARVTKSGKSTGTMPAQPFMRPAVEQMTPQFVEQTWSKAAGRNLKRQLEKL
ncbi:MAG: HK97-gp10 family putative phage morphogenesis protein [Parasphingorhabdus sp.]|uniref:HK97-gp10 family putative phage morphogenesis protein n=1 Tax=Sphingomonadales TaxID=204457 RepID=UPI003263488D